jgi:hypothetical protein
VKGGQIGMRTLDAKKCCDAVASLLQMGYTAHVAFDRVWETYGYQLQ